MEDWFKVGHICTKKVGKNTVQHRASQASKGLGYNIISDHLVSEEVWVKH